MTLSTYGRKAKISMHEESISDRVFAKMGWLILAIFLIWAVASVVGLVKIYPLNVQTGRLYTRCQEAGDLETLSLCLTELLGNMQEVGMVEGRDLRFFPGPENDMARDFANLQTIQTRAQQVAQENQFEDLAYQYAMTEMRDQLQVLGISTRDWFFIHTFELIGFVFHIGWSVWAILLIIWGIWATIRDW